MVDGWKRLDEGSKNLLKIFEAILLVAWRLLNSAFLISPLGLITSLILAIGLLWDDYQVWKEGGKSLIDWEKWEPVINYVLKALENISSAFGDLWTSVKGLGKSLGEVWDKLEPLAKEFGELIGLDFNKFSGKSLFDSLTHSIIDSIKVLSNLVDALKKVIDGDFSGAFGSLKIAGGIVLDGAKDSISGRIYSTLNDKLNHYLPSWAGGAADNVWSGDESERPAQSAKVPRGIRNNNPGNIDFRGQAGATLERPGGRFARFETAYDGLKALARQLMRYFEGKTTGKPLNTLNDIISTWAPRNENNTGAYIAQLSKMMGVSPDAILNPNDPQVMSSLMNGITYHENGRNPYPGELVRMAAVGGSSHSIQQETVINIHGVSNPREAAWLMVDRQKGVNAQLAQQLTAVPR